MLNTSFSPWPNFSQEEAEAVQQVLISNKVNYWTGEECRKFEKKFAAFTGCEYAIALANGTLALEMALKALDIGAGNEVIVTSRTFLASVSSIVIAGAIPVRRLWSMRVASGESTSRMRGSPPRITPRRDYTDGVGSRNVTAGLLLRSSIRGGVEWPPVFRPAI